MSILPSHSLIFTSKTSIKPNYFTSFLPSSSTRSSKFTNRSQFSVRSSFSPFIDPRDLFKSKSTRNIPNDDSNDKDKPVSFVDEWGEKSGPEPQPVTKLSDSDPPIDIDEWGKAEVGSTNSSGIEDEWGEKSGPELRPVKTVSDSDPPIDEDEWIGAKQVSKESDPEPVVNLPDSDTPKDKDERVGAKVGKTDPTRTRTRARIFPLPSLVPNLGKLVVNTIDQVENEAELVGKITAGVVENGTEVVGKITAGVVEDGTEVVGKITAGVVEDGTAVVGKITAGVVEDGTEVVGKITAGVVEDGAAVVGKITAGVVEDGTAVVGKITAGVVEDGTTVVGKITAGVVEDGTAVVGKITAGVVEDGTEVVGKITAGVVEDGTEVVGKITAGVVEDGTAVVGKITAGVVEDTELVGKISAGVVEDGTKVVGKISAGVVEDGTEVVGKITAGVVEDTELVGKITTGVVKDGTEVVGKITVGVVDEAELVGKITAGVVKDEVELVGKITEGVVKDGTELLGKITEGVVEDLRIVELKRRLIDVVNGTDFGLRASSEVRAEVLELVSQLEAANPTPNPVESSQLLDGNWILVFTAFSELLPLLAVGTIPLLKVEKISQAISTSRLTIENSTTLSIPVANLSFSATAAFEVRSPSRIQVEFKEGTLKPPEIKLKSVLPENLDIFGQNISLSPVQLSLNPLDYVVAAISRAISGLPPVKVPIPGERTKSWLITTYLDKHLRISRGDGGLFVLVKEESFLPDLNKVLPLHI